MFRLWVETEKRIRPIPFPQLWKFYQRVRKIPLHERPQDWASDFHKEQILLLNLSPLFCFVFQNGFLTLCKHCHKHRRSQRGAKGAMPPKKFLENIVILCFERRFSRQNSVIRLKSNIWSPKNFWHPQIFGLATPLVISLTSANQHVQFIFMKLIENRISNFFDRFPVQW